MAVLIVDCGTSVIRAATQAWPTGACVRGRRPTPWLHPAADYAEIDLEALWEGVIAAVRDGENAADAPATIEAVAITAVMGWVGLREGRPITPGISYADRRAAGCVSAAASEIGTDLNDFPRRFGRRLSAEYLLPLDCWFRKHHGSAAPQQWATIKDYIVWRLTGEWGVDSIQAGYSAMAPLSLFVDRPSRANGLSADSRLVPIQYPYECAGAVVPGAATAMGIAAGVPVARGTSDGSTAMIGGGVLDAAAVAMTSGSTDVVMALISADPMTDSAVNEMLVWNSLAPGRWLVGNSTGSTGRFLQQLQSTYGCRLLDADITTVPPGADGLSVFPAIEGERAPSFRTDQRGAVIGLTAQHRPAHLKRAVYEAAAYRTAAILSALRGAGAEATRIVAGGGGLSEPAARMIRAAVCNVTVVPSVVGETALAGCGLFAAGVARGLDPADPIGQLQDLWRAFQSTNADRTGAPATADPALVSTYKTFGKRYADVETAMSTVWPLTTPIFPEENKNS